MKSLDGDTFEVQKSRQGNLLSRGHVESGKQRTIRSNLRGVPT